MEAFINAAVQEQFDYGFSMDELIPRIPGSMHLNGLEEFNDGN